VTGAVSEIVAGYFGTRHVALHVTATYAVPAALGGGSITAKRRLRRSMSWQTVARH